MSEKFFSQRRVAVKLIFALALLATPFPIFATQRATPAGQSAAGSAQKPAQTAAGEARAGEKPWSVKVTKSAPRTFTVKAKEANLSEITGEISRLINVPITVTPLMAKQRVTLDFGGLNLEAAMRMLAPQVYIDYVAGGSDIEPKPLAIYLQALNEKPPSANATVHGSSEAILIEGNTEEGTDGDAQKKEEEDPLKVAFANNQLSVRAHKQPLSVVLYKIANEIGVPFEMRYESPEIIDVEFNNYSLDQAVRSLSPEVRFYYRQDLQTYQVQPLRLALVAPATLKS